MTSLETVVEAAGIGPCTICGDHLDHGTVVAWTVGGWAHDDCADSPLAAPVDTTNLTPHAVVPGGDGARTLRVRPASNNQASRTEHR